MYVLFYLYMLDSFAKLSYRCEFAINSSYKRNASPCYGYKFRRSHRPLEKHGSAKFHVDVKEEGGRGSDLNVQWTLSGELVNMSTVPK